MKIAAFAIAAGITDTGHEKSAFIAPALGAIGRGVMGAASKYLPRLGNALMAGKPMRAMEVATNPAAGPLAAKLGQGAAQKAIAGREKLVGAGTLGLGALGLNHMAQPPVAEEEKIATMLGAIGSAVNQGAKALSPGLSMGAKPLSRAQAIMARSRRGSLAKVLAARGADTTNAGIGAGALGVLGGAGLASRAGAFDEVPPNHMPITAY